MDGLEHGFELERPRACVPSNAGRADEGDRDPVGAARRRAHVAAHRHRERDHRGLGHGAAADQACRVGAHERVRCAVDPRAAPHARRRSGARTHRRQGRCREGRRERQQLVGYRDDRNRAARREERQSPGCQSPGCQSPGCQSSGCQSSGCQSSGCQSPGCQSGERARDPTHGQERDGRRSPVRSPGRGRDAHGDCTSSWSARVGALLRHAPGSCAARERPHRSHVARRGTQRRVQRQQRLERRITLVAEPPCGPARDRRAPTDRHARGDARRRTCAWLGLHAPRRRRPDARVRRGELRARARDRVGALPASRAHRAGHPGRAVAAREPRCGRSAGRGVA